MIRTRRGDLVTTGKHPHGSPNALLVTYSELREFGVHFSRKHLLDLMKRDLFPKCRQVSANRVAWMRVEIEDYNVASRPIARAALSARVDAA
jgi:predicted DNA-binding transcriptional regulator AlpA